MIEFEKYKEILEEDTTIVFDTNILLELYRVSSKASRDILDILDRVKDKTWIPRQVYKEYYKHKDSEKRKQNNKYKNIITEFKTEIDKMETSIKKKFYRYRKFDFPDINNVESNFGEKINELREIVNNYVNDLEDEIKDNKKLLKEDNAAKYIIDLHNGSKIGAGFDIVDIIEIIKEGELRYKYDIPPGYEDRGKEDSTSKDNKSKNKDEDKDKLSKFGDLFVWKELIKFAGENANSILFITNDEKPDWWEIINDRLIGPRKELVEEFVKCNEDKNIYFLPLKDFYSLTSKYYNVLSFLTELELNAEKYVKDELLKEIDSQVSETISDFVYFDIDYDNLIGLPIDEVEEIFFDYDLKESTFEVINNKAIYYIALKVEGCINLYRVYRESDEDDIKIEMGDVDLYIDMEIKVSKEIDIENNILKDDMEYKVDSIEVVKYNYIDPDERIEMDRQTAEADMMDALEENYRY